MQSPEASHSVERLFPFVLRSRALMIGREALRHSKRHLHFVLITTDISGRSREEILSDFAFYPVVQRYTSEDLQQFFGIKGAKVIGFRKSGLAKSIYAELKPFRINEPPPARPKGESKSGPPAAEPRKTGQGTKS